MILCSFVFLCIHLFIQELFITHPHAMCQTVCEVLQLSEMLDLSLYLSPSCIVLKAFRPIAPAVDKLLFREILLET